MVRWVTVPAVRTIALCGLLAGLASGCAGTDYGGTNYVTVQTQTETWKVVGGKDETDVEFQAEFPDGRVVTYRAASSNASVVLAAIAKQQQDAIDKLTAIVAKLAMAPVHP